MLKLILGGPGSGKTKKIIDMIRESVKSGNKTYLLVPEQQAFISESMLADLPPSSALCFEVVSFSRLCEIAFTQYGGLTNQPASSGMRNLIMWQSLRQISPHLTEYGKIKPDKALTSLMLSMVTELRVNSITPEKIEEAAEKCSDPTLSAKLKDITAVYANFERLLSERMGEQAILAENKLSRLISLLEEKQNCFENIHLYVDSFFSFTAEEMKILELLMDRAGLFCISLCTESKLRRLHTESVCETLRRIIDFARRHEIETEEIILKENLRSSNAEIYEIGKNLWNFSLDKSSLPQISQEERGHVQLAECVNEYEEAYYAALNILKAKQDGVKFSEMAVIMHDCESRKGIIDAVFTDAGIPYFYSQRTSLASTPLARLVLSALRCVAFNFRSDDVMTLLKTGLCGIDEGEADMFEDYCYTWGIEGSGFTDAPTPWSMNANGYTTQKSDRGDSIRKAANSVKLKLIPPLMRLKGEYSAAKNALEACRALCNYLESISLSQNLSSLASFALSIGDTREAGELLRVFDHLMTSITDIATVMAEDKLSAEELAYALEILLTNTDMGSVPTVGDYVTVGSASTLRVENIKLAVLLGLCEGEFPGNYSDSGLLSEGDKSRLEELSISLDSRESRIVSDELFHALRAMCIPSEKLILCTCTSRIGGGALTPSSAWNRVRYVLDYITPEKFRLSRVRSISAVHGENIADGGDIVGDTDTVVAATEDNTDQAVVADSTENFTEKLSEADKESFVNIDPLYVRMLFGDTLRLTKSRISSFVECPYKYWCDYVLKLRVREIAKVSYADSGTIIHFVLEKFLAKIRESDGGLRDVSDDEIVSSVNDIMNEYIGGINCNRTSTLMYSFSRVRDLALIMVKSVLDEFKQSSFKIVAFEKDISDRGGDSLHPMEIKVGEGDNTPIVSLGGVVDRIDRYDGEDGRFLRVVDYKTGSHRFDVSKVANGADLQLPAYLFTAALDENKSFFGEADPLFPASAVFLSAEEKGGRISPVRSGFVLAEENFLHAVNHNNEKKMMAGAYIKKDGTITGDSALSRDGIIQMRDTLRSTIAKTAENMYSGKAPRTPSKDSCAFCPMKASCPVAHKE